MAIRKYIFLTNKLAIAIMLGTIFGLVINHLSETNSTSLFLTFSENTLYVSSQLFINAVYMLIVPIVFFTVVPSTIKLCNNHYFGRVLTKTLLFYVFFTLLALSMGILVANALSLGSNLNITPSDNIMSLLNITETQNVSNIFTSMLPYNPIEAMMNGRIPALIVFSVLLGVAIAISGDKAENLKRFFVELDITTTRLFSIIMLLTPCGVFSLISVYFAQYGFTIVGELTVFFFATLGLLLFQLFIINGLLFYLFTKLNPVMFFRKISHALLFAFSTSSSNATIPIALDTTRKLLGVKREIAGINISIGASLNTNGTAVMLAMATVLIANFYQIDLGLYHYFIILFIGLLVSIATPGMPFVGLISLATLLDYLGLPIEGIALIFAADKLLDMFRSSVNIGSDMTIACIIAKQEDSLDESIFYTEPDALNEESLLDQGK